MQEKRFHREDYPLTILADFGLSEEMIYDLPDFVHEKIERGGQSPLLPICIQQPFGETHAFAKFSIVSTEHGIDVLFYPKLKSINLDQFSEHDKKLLLDGKVIVADIDEPSTDNDNKNDSEESVHRTKAFVQLDRDTNDVVYTPTQVIGRNLSAIAGEYNLNGDDLQKFWRGDILTVMEKNDSGDEEPVTIGIDLMTDNGVIVIPGTKEQWENTVRRVMPEYSFGNDGCWVNRHGHLQYVPDDQFTKEFYDVLQRNAQQVEETLAKEQAESIHINNDQEQTTNQEELRQLTR